MLNVLFNLQLNFNHTGNERDVMSNSRTSMRIENLGYIYLFVTV